MARKHKPEELIGKLREAEIVLALCGTAAGACRRIGVTEQGYYRWRKEYGGLKMDQTRRMKELEKENARLRRAVLHVLQRQQYDHHGCATDGRLTVGRRKLAFQTF
jgi:hypothetical protein